MQLSTRVLTNFEINLAPSLLNFVRHAVPVPYLFLDYYRPGLLFADFGDAKLLYGGPGIKLDNYHSYPGGAGFTCQYPALDSFYWDGVVVSHLQGFPTFQVLASTRVP